MDDDSGDFYVIERPKYKLISGSIDEEEEVEETSSQPAIVICSGVGAALIGCAIFTTGILQFLAIWIALALLVGPHAPSAYTGGDCRVGAGTELLEAEPEPEVREGMKRVSSRSKKGVALSADDSILSPPPASENGSDVVTVGEDSVGALSGWSRESQERLKKAVVKFPKGTPRRWEAVTSAMGGKKSMEEVIKAGKSLEESEETVINGA